MLVCLSSLYLIAHTIRYRGDRNYSVIVILHNDFMVWKFPLWHHVGNQKSLNSEAYRILDFECKDALTTLLSYFLVYI